MTEYERLYNLYMEKSNDDLLKIVNSKFGYTDIAVEVASDILKYIRNIEDAQILEQNNHKDKAQVKNNFFKNKIKEFLNLFITPNVNTPKTETKITDDYTPENHTNKPASSSEFSIKIQYGNSILPSAKIYTQNKVSDYDLQIEYVRLSTSGDENVCPMCAQFEGKIFHATDAPKLPLCPSCACAYEYYYKEDLPPNAEISCKENFFLPAECTSLFYKHQQSLYTETDVNKIIRICESDLRKLSEFMAPYITANFDAPPELACRDLLPELYMQLGQWNKAEKAIKKCIEAKAYYPDDGLTELTYLTSYRRIATEVIAYLQQNPGYLQRNMYRAMGYIGEEKELLKDFLRNSKLIKKVKYNNTNQLFCNTEETINPVK